MKLADYFIGKPGPGSNQRGAGHGPSAHRGAQRVTMVQERFNTDWIAQNKFGVVLPSFAR